MKPLLVPLLCLLSFLLCRCNTPSQHEKQASNHQESQAEVVKPLVFKLEKVIEGLHAPLALENAADGSNRLFVAQQAGQILIIKNGQLLEEPFLDIHSKLVPMENKYMDTGILGFAFHPQYRSNGRFFVHYSAPSSKKGSDHKSVLEEFTVSSTNADKANPVGKHILEVEQPEANHNGGNIVFDQKGYLYLGFGDGGGQGDAHQVIGNGQDLNKLLGKIIRIDIDHGNPYQIPADNPFVGKEGRDEIWAYGLRMPWRISFDKKTGELFCGDVGQNSYEEVNIIEKGKNYGWRAMEGETPYDTTLYEKGGVFTAPIHTYSHPLGISITGGYVYRGKQFPVMEGKYFFGDWAFKVFYLEKNANQQWIRQDCQVEGKSDNSFEFRVNSFGIDEQGEIYIVTQDEIGAISPTGVVYKMILAR